MGFYVYPQSGVPSAAEGTVGSHVVSDPDPRRAIPSVQRVIEALDPQSARALRVTCARAAVAAARDAIEAGTSPSEAEVIADAAAALRGKRLALLGPVVNATGILLHTNLGRSPLSAELLEAMSAAAGYTNLEYQLDEGRRGSRHAHAGHLFAEAVGAQAGMVVNNNAAAVLLCLAALARDREVVVSRGELVEIGGGFRVPEIMAETRARLVEVGTTNRTRADDYRGALGAETALLLKVHASNYRMIGFVAETPIAELALLGPPVMVDAGSGLLDETTPWLDAPPDWLAGEPGVRQCLEAGARIVTFSGDKLLGGQQAGIIVGDRELVHRCASHPLARAVRADKLTLAGLQAVALAYLAGEPDLLGFWRLATEPMSALAARADALALGLAGAKVIETEAAAGGGSLPGRTIPSVGVAISVDDVDGVLAALRSERIVARAQDGAVVCDLRTVEAGDDQRLAAALARATGGDSSSAGT